MLTELINPKTGEFLDDAVQSGDEGKYVTSTATGDEIEKQSMQPDMYPLMVYPYGGNFVTNVAPYRITESEENTITKNINGVEVKITSNRNIGKNIEVNLEPTIKEFIDSFMQDVSNMVDFDYFTITDYNAELSGSLLQNRLNFTYSLDDNNGLYITTNNLQINDSIMQIINNLNTNYKIFEQKFGEYISNVKYDENE